ncbi:unnamed protein product [Paramecium sonneborni]|uniref:Uncharacterized protein n=1 Tax=Paramecium sonneborni TaxID=65129 RepID=A0A8S1P5X3_9CILI|nr:unnamed protein product [Paramecium sonneborni]
MFKNFIKKEALCELHQSQIQFLNISNDSLKGKRALCEECDLDKPISLKKGQQILNNLEEFVKQTIQQRTTQIYQTINSEIENLEKEFKQFMFRIKNQINEIIKNNALTPFEKYKEQEVFTTSNYQDIAELLQSYYSIKENKYIITEGLEKCVQNVIKNYQQHLKEIQQTRKYFQQSCNSYEINNEYVEIQIYEEVQLIECNLETNLKYIFDLFYCNQDSQDLKCYYKNKLIENMNQTLREIKQQDQSNIMPLIIKRVI